MDATRSRLTGPPARSRFAIPRSASEARHLVEDLVRAEFPAGSEAEPAAETMADVLLVTSELATNAIRHGGGIVGLWARVDADGLRLGVRDRSDTVPHDRPRAAGDAVPLGGYGWPLVRRLVSELTVTRCPGGGKEIRITLPLS
ncbi:ATP-binding protein [Streptomyces sp. NPDC057702]|uniref:ATP-binding protein n=1 Tax=unclassified Streptomyces TaxID=2593676 RepID=UPI003674F5A1